MKNNNSKMRYLNGRLSIIAEAKKWINLQIEKIQEIDKNDSDKYKHCTRVGIIRAYKNTIRRLDVKKASSLKKIREIKESNA